MNTGMMKTFEIPVWRPLLSNQSTIKPKPQVVFGSKVRREFLQGSEQITAAVRPTLGPSPRLTLIENAIPEKAPELLDSGGLIARRILQLSERTQDVGAMMLRHTLWRMSELVGDGTATTAVLFQAVMREGHRYIAAGGDPMALRYQLEAAMRLVILELDRMARPIQNSEQLKRLAHTICGDWELAKALSEIVDVVGAFGFLEFRKSQSRNLKIEYREGNYWQNSGLLSKVMINDHVLQRAYTEDVFILATDLVVAKTEDLIPLFAAAQQAGAKRLILVTREIEDSVMGTLMLPKNRKRIEVFGAKTPGISAEAQMEAIEELNIITGAIPLVGAAGDTWKQLTPEHLGQARRAWISKHYLGIIGGKTDSIELRKYIRTLRKKYDLADKVADKTAIQNRIGRLQGGATMLYVSGATETEIEARLEHAKKIAQTLRVALRDGVVPGGGSALLACCPILENRAASADNPEERAAYRILSHALQQPLNVIAENAGNFSEKALIEVRRAVLEDQKLLSFDALKKQAVDPFESGLLDSAGVTKAALRSAITSAALALTIDVIIHKKNPPQVLDT